ncbi:MAG: uroporphyrinogen decarboxylase family protein, partial [Thermodesulfobacteriota bacterium]
AAIRGLKTASRGEVPIIGVVMSPFSLPVMQMGFEAYMALLYERPGLFWQLMHINQKFCVEWANAQLDAGATVICYFDPLLSPNIVERATAVRTGFVVARKTMAQIKGPTATHLASGCGLPVIDEVAATGTAVVAASVNEDLEAVKSACFGRLSVLGNLNGIEMRHWRADEAAFHVRQAIAKAGAGGGFILADNHGEIPFQVPDRVLLRISETVCRHGRYPLPSSIIFQANAG